MHTFIEDNSKKNHDAFVTHHPLCNLLQSSNWAKVKENWNHAFTAVYEGDSMVAAALVLIKRLPMGFTMMYIPRGPVMDYDNTELVKFYLDALKSWAKKKKCLFITFDPALILRQFQLDAKDTPYDDKILSTIDVLKNNGAIFKGFTKSIADTIQPRFHMGLYNKENWKDDLPKSTMKSVRKAQNKKVEINEIDVDRMDEFARIMHLTEERKQVHLRGKEYFQRLKKAYGKDAHVFLAKVDPEKRHMELNEKLTELQDKLKDEKLKDKGIRKINEEIRKTKEELASIDEVWKTCDSETVMSCGLMIVYGNYAEMLYAGMDDTYRAFRAQYLLYIKQFELAFEQGCQFVTMGGVEGTLDDGLSVFKSNYNPTVVEYVGEFDLPVNKTMYKAAKFLQKLRTGK